MKQKEPLRELFKTLIKDDDERQIINLIIDGKCPEDIVDDFIGFSKKGG
jgi:hypothetical protein